MPHTPRWKVSRTGVALRYLLAGYGKSIQLHEHSVSCGSSAALVTERGSTVTMHTYGPCVAYCPTSLLALVGSRRVGSCRSKKAKTMGLPLGRPSLMIGNTKC